MTESRQSAAVPPSRALVVVLCSFGFVLSLNSGMLNPVLPDIARTLGVSIATVGQLTAASMMTGAAATLIVGTLSDLYGRRPFIAGGLTITGISALTLAFAPTFTWALLCRALAGFGFVTAVTLALVGDWYRGAERDRVAARILATDALAWVAGVPAMAAIAQFAGWRMGVGLSGCLGITAAIVSLTFLPRRPRQPATTGLGQTLAGIWVQHRHRPGLVLTLLANALRSTFFTGFLTYSSAFYVDNFGLKTWQLGLLLSAGAIAFIAGTEIGGRWGAQLGARILATVTCSCAGLLGALISFLPILPLDLVFMVGYCALCGTASAALIGLTLRLAPETRGATMALNSTLSSLGGAVGIAAGGFGIAVMGYQGLGIIVALFAFLAAGLMRLPALAPAEAVDAAFNQ